MALYPSCLYNRVQEAKRHMSSVMRVGKEFVGYPYHIVDLSVRMRPIVEEIDEVRKSKKEIELLKFEPSRSFAANDRYSSRNDVGIMVLLGAIIHERYIHIGVTEEDERTVRLDVMSDRGRWIVRLSEFLSSLHSYLLSQDEIALIVCEMIDNYTNEVARDEVKYRTRPPKFGNHDLDWLLWEYATQEPGLKRMLMSDVFGAHEVPDYVVSQLRFSANHIGYKGFDLYISPHAWNGWNADCRRAASWTTLSETVRRYVNGK